MACETVVVVDRDIRCRVSHGAHVAHVPTHDGARLVEDLDDPSLLQGLWDDRPHGCTRAGTVEMERNWLARVQLAGCIVEMGAGRGETLHGVQETSSEMAYGEDGPCIPGGVHEVCEGLQESAAVGRADAKEDSDEQRGHGQDHHGLAAE